jgi:hypothetical protein
MIPGRTHECALFRVLDRVKRSRDKPVPTDMRVDGPSNGCQRQIKALKEVDTRNTAMHTIYH